MEVECSVDNITCICVYIYFIVRYNHSDPNVTMNSELGGKWK
jgi:hypothetical protein